MQIQLTIPSRQILEGIPLRAARFLMVLGTRKAIRRALARRGYTAAVHARGWKLVHDASGYVEKEDALRALPSAPSADPDAPGKQAEALAELDVLDGEILKVSQASLQSNHPEVAQLLLSDLEPATGVQAMLNVKAWLGRVDALEATEGVADDIVQRNAAALATLAERGYTPQECARLKALVAQVEALGTLDEDDASFEERIHQARIALYRWYKEWAQIARVEIKRRDWLILLGLARRRKADGREVIEDIDIDNPGTDADADPDEA